jgi:3-hydroxyisobutyrate dehydrogenase-like beta-hydroxyacid dehydrogenase
MINFSLMGAGRIGKMHAKFIAAHPKAKLKYVYDVNSQFAEEIAKLTGCSIASSPEEAINSDDVMQFLSLQLHQLILNLLQWQQKQERQFFVKSQLI